MRPWANTEELGDTDPDNESDTLLVKLDGGVIGGGRVGLRKGWNSHSRTINPDLCHCLVDTAPNRLPNP